MSVYQYIAIGCSVILLAAAIVVFNRMIALRNKVKRAWKDIEVQLKKRYQLIPLLVQTAEGYSLHEKRLLKSISTKRAEAQAASGAGDRGDKERSLAGELEKILLLREDYPELKADSSFRHLSEELVVVEDHLAASRKYYNGSVRIYNTYIESFPQLLLARPFRFRPAEYFQLGTDKIIP